MARIYVAGPMTGYPQFNFPMFDKAGAWLRSRAWDVVSPADLDREHGYDPTKGGSGVPPDRTKCLERDIEALETCHAICFLPGWQLSQGALEERKRASELGITQYEIRWDETGNVKMSAVEGFNTLLEANRLVHGSRQNAYGHPRQCFAQTAKIWSAVIGTEVSVEQVALCMIGVKMSRLCNTPQHIDSIVDIAGYAETMAMCLEQEAP